MGTGKRPRSQTRSSPKWGRLGERRPLTDGEAGQANTVSTELPQFNRQLRSLLPCTPLAPSPTMHALYTSL